MNTAETEDLFRLQFLPNRLTADELEEIADVSKRVSDRFASRGDTSRVHQFLGIVARTELNRRRANAGEYGDLMPQEAGGLVMPTAMWTAEELADALIVLPALIRTPFKPEIQKLVLAIHRNVLREAAVRIRS